MRVRLDVAGGISLGEEMARFGAAVPRAAKKVLTEKAAEIVSRARPLAPVDDVDGGQLRDSIRATRPTQTKDGSVVIAVVAGGAPLQNLPSESGKPLPGLYAVVQHETHPSKSKFLEAPTFQTAPSIPEAYRAAIDAETGGGA